LKIPFLTYSDIKQEAIRFLSKLHPSHSIPIPIETIIDVQLGINIFPFPRLYKDHCQNGYLSKDRTTIYIDDVQYDQFNEKYRFTLAHELGHYILHESCYEQINYTTSMSLL
jgi:Zn-dependent peptidase ImmA (M78 family)